MSENGSMAGSMIGGSTIGIGGDNESAHASVSAPSSLFPGSRIYKLITEDFPLFPALETLVGIVEWRWASSLGVFVQVIQRLAFVVNPHFNAIWGEAVGTSGISRVFYFLHFPIYDPLEFPYTDITATLQFGIWFSTVVALVLTVSIGLASATLSRTNKQESVNMVAVRLIGRTYSTWVWIPLLQMIAASMVCDSAYKAKSFVQGGNSAPVVTTQSYLATLYADAGSTAASGLNVGTTATSVSLLVQSSLYSSDTNLPIVNAYAPLRGEINDFDFVSFSWYYRYVPATFTKLSTAQCFGPSHTATFIGGVITILTLIPLLVFIRLCDYSNTTKTVSGERRLLGRRHSVCDLFDLGYTGVLVLLYNLMLANGHHAAFALIYCGLSVGMTAVHAYHLPYHNRFVNRLMVASYSLCAYTGALVAAAMYNTTFGQVEGAPVMFLGLTPIVLLIGYVMAEYRLHTPFVHAVERCTLDGNMHDTTTVCTTASAASHTFTPFRQKAHLQTDGPTTLAEAASCIWRVDAGGQTLRCDENSMMGGSGHRFTTTQHDNTNHAGSSNYDAFREGVAVDVGLPESMGHSIHYHPLMELPVDLVSTHREALLREQGRIISERRRGSSHKHATLAEDLADPEYHFRRPQCVEAETQLRAAQGFAANTVPFSTLEHRQRFPAGLEDDTLVLFSPFPDFDSRVRDALTKQIASHQHSVSSSTMANNHNNNRANDPSAGLIYGRRSSTGDLHGVDDVMLTSQRPGSDHQHNTGGAGGGWSNPFSSLFRTASVFSDLFGNFGASSKSNYAHNNNPTDNSLNTGSFNPMDSSHRGEHLFGNGKPHGLHPRRNLPSIIPEPGLKQRVSRLLHPFISNVYSGRDVSLATSFVYQGTWPLHRTPSAEMLLLAAHMYARGLVRFRSSPIVLLDFGTFITDYIPSLAAFGTQLLEQLQQCNHLSLLMQFRTTLFASSLRQALGIRNHSHLLHSEAARTLHRSVLSHMTTFWNTLAEPSVNIGQVAAIADDITLDRRKAIGQFQLAIQRQTASDPKLITRLGEFLQDVMLDTEGATECFNEAREIRDARNARTMRGTRQVTLVELDLQTLSNRLLGLLSSRQDTAVVASKGMVQFLLFKVTIIILFLAAVAGLMVYGTVWQGDQERGVLRRVQAGSEASSSLAMFTAVLYAQDRSESSSAVANATDTLSTLAETFGNALRDVTVGNAASSYKPHLQILHSASIPFSTDSDVLTGASGVAVGAFDASSYVRGVSASPYAYKEGRQTIDFDSISLPQGTSLWELGQILSASMQAIVQSGLDPAISFFHSLTLRDNVHKADSVFQFDVRMFLEEQHANMAKMRIYFVVVFLIGVGVLMVLYFTFYLSLQRTASERMFTFQLTTLIPFESLEFLASEARRKVGIIIAEQQQGSKRGGGGGGALKFNTTDYQLGFSGLGGSTNASSSWLGVSNEDHQAENSQRSSRAPTPLAAAHNATAPIAAAPSHFPSPSATHHNGRRSPPPPTHASAATLSGSDDGDEDDVLGGGGSKPVTSPTTARPLTDIFEDQGVPVKTLSRRAQRGGGKVVIISASDDEKSDSDGADRLPKKRNGGGAMRRGKQVDDDNEEAHGRRRGGGAGAPALTEEEYQSKKKRHQEYLRMFKAPKELQSCLKRGVKQSGATGALISSAAALNSALEPRLMDQPDRRVGVVVGGNSSGAPSKQDRQRQLRSNNGARAKKVRWGGVTIVGADNTVQRQLQSAAVDEKAVSRVVDEEPNDNWDEDEASMEAQRNIEQGRRDRQRQSETRARLRRAYYRYFAVTIAALVLILTIVVTTLLVVVVEEVDAGPKKYENVLSDIIHMGSLQESIVSLNDRGLRFIISGNEDLGTSYFAHRRLIYAELDKLVLLGITENEVSRLLAFEAEFKDQQYVIDDLLALSTFSHPIPIVTDVIPTLHPLVSNATELYERVKERHPLKFASSWKLYNAMYNASVPILLAKFAANPNYVDDFPFNISDPAYLTPSVHNRMFLATLCRHIFVDILTTAATTMTRLETIYHSFVERSVLKLDDISPIKKLTAALACSICAVVLVILLAFLDVHTLTFGYLGRGHIVLLVIVWLPCVALCWVALSDAKHVEFHVVNSRQNIFTALDAYSNLTYSVLARHEVAAAGMFYSFQRSQAITYEQIVRSLVAVVRTTQEEAKETAKIVSMFSMAPTFETALPSAAIVGGKFLASANILTNMQMAATGMVTASLLAIDYFVAQPMKESLDESYWNFYEEPDVQTDMALFRRPLRLDQDIPLTYTNKTYDLATRSPLELTIAAHYTAFGPRYIAHSRVFVETATKVRDSGVATSLDSVKRSAENLKALVISALMTAVIVVITMAGLSYLFLQVLYQLLGLKADGGKVFEGSIYERMMVRARVAVLVLAFLLVAAFGVCMFATNVNESLAKQLYLAQLTKINIADSLLMFHEALANLTISGVSRHADYSTMGHSVDDLISTKRQLLFGSSPLDGRMVALGSTPGFDVPLFGAGDIDAANALLSTLYRDGCGGLLSVDTQSRMSAFLSSTAAAVQDSAVTASRDSNALGSFSPYNTDPTATSPTGSGQLQLRMLNTALVRWSELLSVISESASRFETYEEQRAYFQSILNEMTAAAPGIISGVSEVTSNLSAHLYAELDTITTVSLIVASLFAAAVAIVYFFVFIPIVQLLVEEAENAKLLLRMIPASAREQVPAIAEFVETGRIDNAAELQKKFEASEKLLQNILPTKIARRLKAGEQPIADMHESISILFTDLVGFTKRSSSMAAFEIVDFLNEIFLEFDTIAELLELEKIKTIGDAYFLAGGLDPTIKDHAMRVIEASLLFFTSLHEHNERHAGRDPLRMRLGVHTGPAVAGVIGKSKVAYDLWGESVEIANAMETTGVPGLVHISETTAHDVQGYYRLEDRGELPREKESIPDNMPATFLVTGRLLPTPYMHLVRPKLHSKSAHGSLGGASTSSMHGTKKEGSSSTPRKKKLLPKDAPPSSSPT